MASTRTAMFGRSGAQGIVAIEDMSRTTGRRFFVDSGSSGNGPTSGFGDGPDKPFDTINNAIDSGNLSATRGDIIYVMPGHAETLTTAITMDIDDISIIGLSEGTARPQITGGLAGDNITVTAANCRISGLYFNESTSVATANINIAGANCRVDGCHFDLGDVNNLECITIEDAGDNALIHDNTVIVTGDGPDTWVEIESASTDNTRIFNNHIICSDGTNAFDAAAINSTVANTNLLVMGNTFLGAGVAAIAVVAASAVDKNILSNHYGSDVTNVDQDQFDGQVTVHAEAAPLVVDDAVWYVDSVNGNASFDGHTPLSALVTIAAAEALAAAGDAIIVASGHAETITTGVTFNLAGLTILGAGTGTRKPSITSNVADDTFSLDAANITIRNILFNEATSVSGGAINVAAAGCKIIDCDLDLGANDAEAVTIEAAGDGLLVDNCEFRVTADGPVAAIEIEGTSSNLVVRNCLFDGGSDTNAFDAAAVNSTAACTGVRFDGNDFRFCLSGQMFIDLTTITEPPVILPNNTFKSGAALASQLNPPTTFYVDSGKGYDVAGAGTNRHTPAATLDHAVGLCSANANDTIILVAGHAETINVAAACDLDVAGITVVGEGAGADRPTLTVATDDAATITVSAASVAMKNIIVSNTRDNVTSLMTVSGADFDFGNCETRDTGAVEAALVWTLTGDRWHVHDYVHVGEGSGDQAVAVFQATGTDRGILENFDIDAAGSTALFSSLSTANTLMRIRNGVMTQREAAVGVAVSLLGGDSGFIGPNVHIRLVDTDTDPFAAIDSGSNVNFLGPITVVAGDDEAGLDITTSLTIEDDQSLVPTPWGMARVVTEVFAALGSLVPIFTPSVGRSLILGLYCEITTEVGTQADWKVQVTTTATGAVDITALTVMDTVKVENFFGVTGLFTDDLILGQARCLRPFIVDGGASGSTIGVLGSEADIATGDATWYCVYIPLERGALITAAA